MINLKRFETLNCYRFLMNELSRETKHSNVTKMKIRDISHATYYGQQYVIRVNQTMCQYSRLCRGEKLPSNNLYYNEWCYKY